MGWFNYQGTELFLSDKIFDISYHFLESVNVEYSRKFGRNMKIEELEAILKLSLRFADEDLIEHFEDKTVDAVKIDTSSKDKYQKFITGDIFAVPLKNHGFAYGRIVNVSEKDNLATLEIFSFFSYRDYYKSDIAESGRLMPLFVETGDFFKSWNWLIIGHDEKNIDKNIGMLNLVADSLGDYNFKPESNVEPIFNKHTAAPGSPENRANEIEEVLNKKGIISKMGKEFMDALTANEFDDI